uniref:Putative monocarboxylate transporter monocarboxylate transporter n=1 Tax=Anopheles aquasalis TaxID=42839 RepID=T1E894_ANOAQ
MAVDHRILPGVALANFTLCVSEYSSLEKLPAAFGWHMVGKGVFVILFGPLIGAIRDWTDSYAICIHSQSFCIFLCVTAWSIELLLKRCRTKKNHRGYPFAQSGCLAGRTQDE